MNMKLLNKRAGQRCLSHSVVLSVAVAFGTARASAQIIAWDFNGNVGNETTVNATTNDGSLNTAVISRGAGLNTSSLGNAFSSTNYTASGNEANAISNNKYVQFGIGATPGNQVSLSTLDAVFRRSSTGPNAFRWQYSLDGFATAGTNINATAISYTTSPTNGDAQAQLSLSSITAMQSVAAGSTITIRLYGWGASATTGTAALGRLTGNDLAVGGTVSAITGSLYWDLNGSTPGVGGTGPGTWDTSTTANWNTNSGGTNNATYYSQAATPTFAGTPGTVNVAAAGVTVNGGMIFSASGYTIQNNAVTLGTNPTIEVTTAGHSASVNSTIAGGNGLIKTGAGVLTVGATNSYTGDTQIQNGTLALGSSGSIANSPKIILSNAAKLDVSAVTGGFSLASGQSIAGSGSVYGPVTVASGKVSPGESAGSLTFNSSVTFSSSSTLDIEAGGSQSGVDFDLVTVSGSGNTLTIGGATLVVNPTASAQTGVAYRVVEAVNGAVLDVSNFFGGLTNDQEYVASSVYKYIVRADTSHVEIEFTAIPEPTSLSLLAFAGMMGRRRRK